MVLAVATAQLLKFRRFDLLPAKFFISLSRFLLRPDVFTFTSTLRLVLFYAISTELRVGSYFTLIGASIFSFALLGF